MNALFHITRSTRMLTLLLVTPLSLAAQSGTWTKQAPIPTGANAWSLAALSPNEIWVTTSPMLGDEGGVAHTTDAGQSWETTSFGAGQADAIFFLDAQHGWVAGNAFRHTIDGGATWVKDNDWGSIYDLFFLDAMHGWACGNGAVAYRTTNGGSSWSAVSTPGGSTLSSIWFTDLSNGWCVSISGQILHSTDGGQSWFLQHDSGEYLSTIQFLSALEGWAIGGDTFLHTVNGGANWTKATVPIETWSHGARFSDALHGVAVGEYGNIVRTVNGGQSWQRIAAIGTGPRLWDVEFGDALTAFYSGDSGAINRSVDGGSTWTSAQSGGTGITRAIDFLDGQRAWAANEGGEVLSTSNGGMQWLRVAVTGFDVYGQIHDVDFVDASRGWAVGKNDYFGGSDGRISRSSDGGLHWTPQLSLPDVEFFGIAAADTQTAIAFGRGLFTGTMVRTTDGGAHWIPAGPATGGFRDAFFLDASTGWAVGSDIHKTTDAGASWVEQYAGSGAELASVSFADSQNGWVAGFANVLLHTSDGGVTWTPQDAGAPPFTAYMGISAVSASTAWVAGWGGFVARTTDGGLSWQRESLPGAGEAFFECAEFLGEGEGWVAGDAGIWRRDVVDGCGNASNYCLANANSTGSAASITFAGSCTAAENHFTLQASPVPDQLFLFFFGPNANQVPFGNGYLCIGGGLTRLNPPAVAAANLASHRVDLAAYGFTAGSTERFQCWYRDPAAGGAAFNSSDGLRVTFE
jgi:photosystem II stability/assembly factor-like uncharacterized protein